MAGTQRAQETPQEITVTNQAVDSSFDLAMNTQNDKLDLLATELLRTAVLRDDELEDIASQNELFSSVRARIISDNVVRVEGLSTITFFQRTLILTAAAAVIVFAFYGTLLVARRTNDGTAAKTSSVPKQNQNYATAARHVDPPVQPQDSLTEPEPKTITPRFEKAMDYRPVVSERRTLTKAQPQLEEQQPPQFFALAGLRPSEVAVDGSRIIRVELPRASLVTLGVNVPLDSDKQLIRTDLLVGPDGVPRAIRLVE